MQPFKSHTGIAVPLIQDDINTDQIAPVQAIAETKRMHDPPHQQLRTCVLRFDGSHDPRSLHLGYCIGHKTAVTELHSLKIRWNLDQHGFIQLNCIDASVVSL